MSSPEATAILASMADKTTTEGFAIMLMLTGALVLVAVVFGDD